MRSVNHHFSRILGIVLGVSLVIASLTPFQIVSARPDWEGVEPRHRAMVELLSEYPRVGFSLESAGFSGHYIYSDWEHFSILDKIGLSYFHAEKIRQGAGEDLIFRLTMATAREYPNLLLRSEFLEFLSAYNIGRPLSKRTGPLNPYASNPVATRQSAQLHPKHIAVISDIAHYPIPASELLGAAGFSPEFIFKVRIANLTVEDALAAGIQRLVPRKRHAAIRKMCRLVAKVYPSAMDIASVRSFLGEKDELEFGRLRREVRNYVNPKRGGSTDFSPALMRALSNAGAFAEPEVNSATIAYECRGCTEIQRALLRRGIGTSLWDALQQKLSSVYSYRSGGMSMSFTGRPMPASAAEIDAASQHIADSHNVDMVDQSADSIPRHRAEKTRRSKTEEARLRRPSVKSWWRRGR